MKKKSKKTIYLDYASATPIDKEVAKLMTSLEMNEFANPSAITTGGVNTRKIIEDARVRIASLMYAHMDEIIFTGSGTESIALAIIGTVRGYEGKKIPHIITSTIEHPAVLENCKMLERNGEAEVTYVAPDENGIIDPKDVRDALKENTVLVSVMYANNEIGTVQPIQEIAKIVRHWKKGKQRFAEHGYFSAEKFLELAPSRSLVSANLCFPFFHTDSAGFPLFHTDACQAMNYLFTENIEKLGVDLLSFNSSKIYGPKGVAVLYKKRGINLAPLYYGGGQESGLRSGTENTVSIAGMALAFEKTCKIKNKEVKRLIKIRDYGIKKLLALSKKFGYEIILNGDKENRLPNNINISISGILSELLVIELDAKGIEVSAKSACKSDEPDESYVISAIRQAKPHRQDLWGKTSDGSLRISLGRQTTKQDMDSLVTALKQILQKYKEWK